MPPPLAPAAEPPSERRLRVATARLREGLPVSDEILDAILEQDPAGLQRFTVAEREDIYSDSERVQTARDLLSDAEHVVGEIGCCWIAGRRGVRVLLTGEQEHYRRVLSDRLGADRVVVDLAVASERDVDRLQESLHGQRDELAREGISIAMSGPRGGALEIEYLASDADQAARVLRERLGLAAVLRHRGATNETFRPWPFGSWLAEDDQLHIFYGLPRNGERPGACHVFETEAIVLVGLMIVDWRGAKTLVGGFIPSHATVRLAAPLGNRLVIDDADNRARPHWTDVPAP